MSTDEGILSFLQLSDSFFPIGGYSLSFGLETFSQLGLLKRSEHVASLVSTLVQQLSTLDCPALRASYAAAKRSEKGLIAAIDQKLASFKNVKEFYEASTRTGRAVLRTVESFAPSRLISEYARKIEQGNAPGTYPVCLALVCSSLGIDEERAVMLVLYTSVISLLGAAIRLGNITHLEAQEILHSSKRLLMRAAKSSSSIPWGHMRAFSPALDIMGMQHVYLRSRMFFC